MRKTLDSIYNGAAALAAICMVGLLGMVMLSILGRQFNFHVPGTDAYAGYLMAASGFLALAHTLKRGEHIRVTLLLANLKGRWKKGMALWALGLPAYSPACLPGLAAAWLGNRTPSTTFQRPTTPLRFGFRKLRWPSGP
jgi:TRAP-type C4-dicarboxylate transport system permease small subunit